MRLIGGISRLEESSFLRTSPLFISLSGRGRVTWPNLPQEGQENHFQTRHRQTVTWINSSFISARCQVRYIIIDFISPPTPQAYFNSVVMKKGEQAISVCWKWYWRLERNISCHVVIALLPRGVLNVQIAQRKNEDCLAGRWIYSC